MTNLFLFSLAIAHGLPLFWRTAKPAPCTAALVATPNSDATPMPPPDPVDRLDTLLRWIGTTHPEILKAFENPPLPDYGLFAYGMATGFSIPPLRTREDCPDLNPALDDLEVFVEIDETAKTAAREECVRLGSADVDPALRADWAQRLLTNLIAFGARATKDGGYRFPYRAADGSSRVVSGNPNYKLLNDIATHERAALAGLNDPRVRAYAQTFLTHELPLLVDIVSLRGVLLTSLAPHRDGDLRDELSRVLTAWDARVTALGRSLRGLNEGSAVASIQDPVSEGDEVSRATTRLTLILMHSKTWDEPPEDRAVEPPPAVPSRVWVEAFVRRLGATRTRAFRLLADLESTSREVEALRAFTLGDTPGAARLRGLVEGVATALALRAARERSRLASVNLLDGLLADYLRARVVDERATLGEEFSQALSAASSSVLTREVQSGVVD